MSCSFAEKQARLIEFIRETFDGSLKPAGDCLHHGYISPGGPYALSLWDWDSFWTVKAIIGICQKCNDKVFLQKIVPYAQGTLWNFLEHQGRDGALPIMLSGTVEDVFSSLSHQENNMAKPFIAQYCLMLMDNGLLSAEEISSDAADRILRFHNCCEERYLHENTGLIFWAKDWGIGVDDDPTTWGRPDKSSANILLNTFLCMDYQAAQEIFTRLNRPEDAAGYEPKIARLKNAMQKYCWDEREKAFFTVDIQCNQNLAYNRLWGTMNENLTPFWHCLKLKVLLWTSLLPFYAGIGTQEQFDQFFRENMTPDRLYSAYGVRSLSKDEPMYAPEVIRGNPSNWLGPVWLLTNYIAWEVFNRYGYKAEADRLANIITDMLYKDLQDNGSFHEYYSPESGRGICGENFMSWTALAGLFTLNNP